MRPGRTSGEIGRPDANVNAGRIKLDVCKTGHRQRVGDFAMAANDALIFIDTEQDMSGLTPVGDEHRPPRGGFLGPAGSLIELPAGYGGDRHGRHFCLQGELTMYKHYYKKAFFVNVSFETILGLAAAGSR